MLKYFITKKGKISTHLTGPFPRVQRAATRTSWLSGRKSYLLMIHHRLVRLKIVLIKTAHQTQSRTTLPSGQSTRHVVPIPSKLSLR